MVQWWECSLQCSPGLIVDLVRYLGLVCFWFSSCSEDFSPDAQVFLPPSTNTNIPKFKVNLERWPAWKPTNADLASSLNIVIYFIFISLLLIAFICPLKYLYSAILNNYSITVWNVTTLLRVVGFRNLSLPGSPLHELLVDASLSDGERGRQKTWRNLQRNCHRYDPFSLWDLSWTWGNRRHQNRHCFKWQTKIVCKKKHLRSSQGHRWRPTD